jgi:hypothetical protein
MESIIQRFGSLGRSQEKGTDSRSSALTHEGIVKEGVLRKKGELRWFILHSNPKASLVWYKSQKVTIFFQ